MSSPSFSSEAQRGRIPCLRLHSWDWRSQDESPGRWALDLGLVHGAYCLYVGSNSEEFPGNGQCEHVLRPALPLRLGWGLLSYRHGYGDSERSMTC